MEELANVIENLQNDTENVVENSDSQCFEKSKGKEEDIPSLGNVLNGASNVSREQVMKELDMLSNHPEAIDKMVGSMGKDKDLMNMMKNEKNVSAMASNPKIKKMAEDAKKNVTRKQAIKMNKALTKGLNKDQINKPKANGVMINLSKKFKPYTVDIVGKEKGEAKEMREPNELNVEQLCRSLNAQALKSIQTIDYIIFYDLKSPNNNKMVKRMFPDLELGSQIIVFKKDFSPLSVEELNKELNKVPK